MPVHDPYPAQPPRWDPEPPPAYPGEPAPHSGDPVPGYPEAPPPYPGDPVPGYLDVPPPYPGDSVPAYPGDPVPGYPDAPPPYPGGPEPMAGAEPSPAVPLPRAVTEPPPYPVAPEAVAPPAAPRDLPLPPELPSRPVLPPEPFRASPAGPSMPLLPTAPEPPGLPLLQTAPEPPRLPPEPAEEPSEQPGVPAHQDDLVLQSGRKHLKARQRGADGAAVLQLVVTLPTALISLGVVAIGGSAVNPAVGAVVTVLWVCSGALVFHRPTEAAIARHLLGMRRPGPAEAGRLAEVWAEVARRAGVRPETYELWIQEREELNATATAGHIVAVTRHAMDRLPNSQLAAILAHELGHHVGGHTWAGLLADWYALPARTLRRWTVIVLARLVSSSDNRVAGCGGCLTLVVAAAVLSVAADLWWLLLPAALAPLLVAWLHRRAEYRADDYAVGLDFRAELTEVLTAEHRARTVPLSPPPGPPYVGAPQPPSPPPAPRVTSAHADVKARLDRLGKDVRASAG